MRWLSEAGIALLQISGGTQAQLEFFNAHEPAGIPISSASPVCAVVTRIFPRTCGPVASMRCRYLNNRLVLGKGDWGPDSRAHTLRACNSQAQRQPALEDQIP